MSFEPDILIASRDGSSVALVVEVKLAIADLAAAEQQLKRYMVRMRCPVGMLVTPERMRLYRDTYTGYDEASVERVGEFSMDGVLDRSISSAIRAIPAPQSRGLQLEEAVQAWLEGLTSEAALSALPAELRQAVVEHVSPALRQGEVRAAGPRWRSTGS